MSKNNVDESQFNEPREVVGSKEENKLTIIVN